MNVISWNIRGLGADGKGGWCRKLKTENEVGFILIQETQFSSLDTINVSSFWGSGEFEFEYVDATGRSGSLITLWNPKLFVKASVLKDRNMPVVSGHVKSDGSKLTVVNVYCPQRLQDKRRVWELMKSVKSDGDGLWIVAGDFNSVRDCAERRNSNFDLADSNAFNEFVEDAELYEFGLKGRKFTYLANNKLSRIDRIFVDWTFYNKWPNAEYRVLDRDGSDHFPLLLKIGSSNFGAKPFKFFNSWLEREGFDDVVKNALENFSFTGAPDSLDAEV
ncbi:uncharacterized protein LOC110887669 [Helianthus annuus]|uniref:uncharacterized protein LOC110887669 n=1 Tax=Helianthus annuus TaxID=4232 RepID=UPI000B8FE1E1|nr:uncharacterized protein LOC110887669 [Helianthus annuus]